MKIRIVLLSLILIFANSMVGGDYLGVDESDISQAIHESYNLSASAEPRIDAIIDSSPESPVGYFLKASRLFRLAQYAEVDGPFKAAYVEAAENAFEIAKTYAKNNDGNPRAMYLRAITELSLARYHIEEGHWIRGFFKATGGLKRIRSILEKNPDFHDAKLPIGLANCYLDQAPSYLKPFAFLMRFDGDMETGLKLLHDARNGGFFSRFESSYYLVAVHWELRKDLNAARIEIEDLVSHFPGNADFQRLMGNLDLREKNWDAAFERYATLLKFPLIDDFPGIEVEVRLKLGQHALNQNSLSKAFGYGQIAGMICSDHQSLKGEKAWAFLMQGEALKREERFSEAIRVLKGVEKRDNANAYKIARKSLESIEIGSSEPI